MILPIIIECYTPDYALSVGANDRNIFATPKREEIIPTGSKNIRILKLLEISTI